MARYAHFLTSFGILLIGCAQSTYQVRSEELQRLATVPAADRGKAVRATQDLFSRRPQPPVQAPPPELVHAYVASGLEVAQAAAHLAGTTMRHAPRISGSKSRRQVDLFESNGSSDSSDNDSTAAAVVGVVVAAAIIATGATIALIATEGIRYDGWVQVNSSHPMHLLRGGEHIIVPLSSLDPYLTSWAQEGFFSSEEGALSRLRRAPLDRVGFAYHLELGAGALHASETTPSWGFLTSIALGGFPIHQLGILAKVSLGVGGHDHGTAFNGRYGLEVQGFFASAWRLHFGLYAEVGYGNEWPAQEAGNGLSYGGGGLLQIDLTTRMALTLRSGVSVLSRDGQVVLPVVLLGLGVY